MEVEHSAEDVKLKEGKGSAVRAWRAWRSKHRTPLEEALKDPKGWALYSSLLKESGVRPCDYESCEDWMERNPAQLKWLAWRREHSAPLREALQDAEAWSLFSAMKAERGETVPFSFDDWLKEQSAKRAASDSPWRRWRDAHSGSLSEVLKDPEGLSLFAAERGIEEPIGGNLEEWLNLPSTKGAIAVENWITWRRAHPSSLFKAFEAPEGFALYRAMMTALNKRTEETVEEWRWKFWRRGHSGALEKVLEDPSAWKLFRDSLAKKLARRDPTASIPDTLEEWKEHRQMTRGTDPDTSRPRRNRRSRRTRPKAPPSEELEAWNRWRAAFPSLPIWQLLQEHPDGWVLYEAAFKSSSSHNLPDTLEAFITQQRAQAEWEDWRRKHKGPLLKVLQNQEGWILYRAWKERASITRSTTGHGSEEGCETEEALTTAQQKLSPLLAARDWLIWLQLQQSPLSPSKVSKKERLGLLQLMEQSTEGWQLFSALLNSMGISFPQAFSEFAQRPAQILSEAVNALREEGDPRKQKVLETYALQKALEELTSTRLRFPSFKSWRKQGGLRGPATCSWESWRAGHRGALAEVLTDPEGWALYTQMLSEKKKPVPTSFDEWIQCGKERRAPLVAWLLFRSEHPGELTEVLKSSEAWEVFKAAFPKKVGEASQEEYLMKLAVSAKWRHWREQHAGPLQRVLQQHPDGWELFCQHIQAKEGKAPESFEAWLSLQHARKLPEATTTDSHSQTAVA